MTPNSSSPLEFSRRKPGQTPPAYPCSVVDEWRYGLPSSLRGYTPVNAPAGETHLNIWSVAGEWDAAVPAPPPPITSARGR